MSPQEVLWAIPNSFNGWWPWIVAAFSGPAAIIMLVKMILRHPFDALLVGRCIIAGGLVCFTYRPFNSGLTEIGIAHLVVGSLLSSILLASGWCNREDKTVMLVPFLFHWVVRQICGPRKYIFRPEDIHHER